MLKILKTQPGLHFSEFITQYGYDIADSSIYFLLPDIPATIQAEQVFLKNGGLWGDRLLTFAKLSEIVNIRLARPKNLLSRTARLLLTEQIIAQCSIEFEYYRNISDTKEFADSVLRVIAELKHSEINNDVLLSISRRIRSSSLRTKLRDIIRIYKEYDSKLKSLDLGDDIDDLRQLISHSDKQMITACLPDIKTLVVYGFHELTRSQTDVLSHLDQNGIDVHLFEYDLESNRPSKEISLIAFNSVVEEAQHCARKLKDLLETEKVLPERIAVIDKSGYNNSLLIHELFDSAAIIYSEGGRLKLSSSHIGSLISSILELKNSNFNTRLFFDFLRNPYVINYFGGRNCFYRFCADLELVFLENKITNARSGWDKVDEVLKIKNGSEYIFPITVLIKRIDVSLRPIPPGMLCERFLELLQETVFSKLKDNKIIDSVSEANAISAAFNALREYRFISHNYYDNEDNQSISQFKNIITDLLSDKTYSLTTAHEHGVVKKLDYLHARGTAYDYLFVLGAGENDIPTKHRTDPVIKNSERNIINSTTGVDIFQTSVDKINAEEKLINIILHCSKNVYVSYVNIDNKQALVEPSYILDSYVINNTSSSGKGKSNLVPHDRLLDLFSNAEMVKRRKSRGIENHLSFIVKGINAEIGRQIKYSVLQDTEGYIKAGKLLSSKNEFSVTELQSYGECPYQYFASNILGLDYPDNLDDEPKALDQGSVYHRILYKLFARLTEEFGQKLDLRKVSDEQILYSLQQVISTEDFQKEFGWLSDLKKDLNINGIKNSVLPSFVTTETERIRDGNSSGFFPSLFEQELTLNIDESTVKGKADRIDMSENAAVVIDYKMRSVNYRNFCDYRNLQLPLYLNCLAAQNIEPEGGYYRSTERANDEKGMNRGVKKFQQSMDDSLLFVRSYIDNIKNGIFPASPLDKDKDYFLDTFETGKAKGSPCEYCNFQDLCRAETNTFRTTK